MSKFLFNIYLIVSNEWRQLRYRKCIFLFENNGRRRHKSSASSTICRSDPSHAISYSSHAWVWKLVMRCYTSLLWIYVTDGRTHFDLFIHKSIYCIVNPLKYVCPYAIRTRILWTKMELMQLVWYGMSRPVSSYEKVCHLEWRTSSGVT